MELTTTAPKIEAHIEGEAKVTLSEDAVDAIRRDQIRALHFALIDVKAAEESMPELTSVEARDVLSTLGAALRDAEAAADALWYLAPDDAGDAA